MRRLEQNQILPAASLIERATRDGRDRSSVGKIRGDLVVLEGLHRAPAKSGYSGDVTRHGRTADPYGSVGTVGSDASVDAVNDRGVIDYHANGRAVGRGYDSDIGTAGHHAVPHIDVHDTPAAGAIREDTVGIVFELDAVDVDVDACPAGGPDQDAGKGNIPCVIIPDYGASRHMELAAGDGGSKVDPALGEMIDRALLDGHTPAGGDADAVQAGAEPFNVESAENDEVGGIRDGDDDAIGSRDQHAGLAAFRRDGDRFGDSHGAETAGIENVNFSADRGLGDCAREGFTWRSAAARICVVADAGDPRTGRLRMRCCGEADDKNGCRKESKNFRGDHRGLSFRVNDLPVNSERMRLPAKLSRQFQTRGRTIRACWVA